MRNEPIPANESHDILAGFAVGCLFVPEALDGVEDRSVDADRDSLFHSGMCLRLPCDHRPDGAGGANENPEKAARYAQVEFRTVT